MGKKPKTNSRTNKKATTKPATAKKSKPNKQTNKKN